MLKVTLITICICLGLGVLVAAGPQQVPTVVLMQNIREHANFIGKYGSYDQLNSGEVDFGSHSDVVRSEERRVGKECRL